MREEGQRAPFWAEVGMDPWSENRAQGSKPVLHFSHVEKALCSD